MIWWDVLLQWLKVVSIVVYNYLNRWRFLKHFWSIYRIRELAIRYWGGTDDISVIFHSIFTLNKNCEKSFTPPLLTKAENRWLVCPKTYGAPCRQCRASKRFIASNGCRAFKGCRAINLIEIQIWFSAFLISFVYLKQLNIPLEP